jgi:hypothetical protein
MEYEGKCKSIDDDGIELEHFCSDDVEDVTDELIHEISEINQFEPLVNVNFTVFVCFGLNYKFQPHLGQLCRCITMR